MPEAVMAVPMPNAGIEPHSSLNLPVLKTAYMQFFIAVIMRIYVGNV
jgi:hypothetical protein